MARDDVSLTETITNSAALPARTGKYEITGKIGEGGMGMVFRAVDRDLGRTVALKFLPPELHQKDAEERFLREARAASALDHVNIATIFGIEETEDHHRFIVMAYYEGQSLAERLRETRQPFPAAEAVAIAGQIARGLAAAHACGIIHRDIKPSNILLTAGGVVKIIDFGLASMTASEPLTPASKRIGTPAYMSPEQALGEPVDGRSDIWSTGIVLLEMLTGEHVFHGQSPPQILYQVVHAEIRGLDALDGPLRSVVARAVERDPAKRYRSMGEFLAALERLSPQTLAVRPVPRGTRRGLMRTAALATILAAGAGSAWWFSHKPRIPGAPSSMTVYRQYTQAIQLLARWDKGTNLKDATALLTAATRSEPAFALGFAGLAEAQRLDYVLMHDKTILDAAESNAEQAMRLDANLAQVQVVWGRIQVLRNHNDLAMAGFQRALKIDPNNADAHQAIGKQFARLGRLEDAEAEYRRSLVLDPDSMFLHDAYANFLFHQSRYADAAREWREVVRIAPDNAAAYTNLGAALNESGDPNGAIAMDNRAVQLKPNYVAYSNLGLAYYEQGLSSKAVTALQEALKLDPASAMAWQNLGYVRARIPGMETQALEAFRRAIDLAEQSRKDNPRDADVHAELALCYAKTGNATMARQRLETALALAPKGADILAHAAEVYELLGDQTRAIEFARKSLSLGYPLRRMEINPDIQELLPRLK